MSQGKETVTHQKRQAKPKLQQPYLHTRDDEGERRQQNFYFVQINSRTKNSKHFQLVQESGVLFDSTDPIEQSILSDFKLEAGVAKQVREEFPSMYLEFGSKASKRVESYAQQFSPNRFVHHFS